MLQDQDLLLKPLRLPSLHHVIYCRLHYGTHQILDNINVLSSKYIFRDRLVEGRLDLDSQCKHVGCDIVSYTTTGNELLATCQLRYKAK